jgi:hypothetical protein
MEATHDYKKDCLLAEHAGLSAFVEQEVVATSILRGLAAASWVVAMTTTITAGGGIRPGAALAILAALAAIWVADLWFSYVGVVYKMRRLEVRNLIDRLPAASTDEVAGWKSPVNPFETVGGAGKKQALRDALTSPAGAAVYVLLLLATPVVLALS